MKFSISHTTEYVYTAAALESFSELRCHPQNSIRQTVLSHEMILSPTVPVYFYTDYFGNKTSFFSIPFKHNRLIVETKSIVLTHPYPDPLGDVNLSVSEALIVYGFQRFELFDFLLPSKYISLLSETKELSSKIFQREKPLIEALLELNQFIHQFLSYAPGTTDISTSVSELLILRKGVCQDYTHLMIAVLRATGIPARYVSGYIEPIKEESSVKQPIGVATHAWVEVYLPNKKWVGFDPTNNTVEGEYHIQIAVGRDYDDVAPLRGIFKGYHGQELNVAVQVERV
ncbi:transglutaminase family protein [Candidatus Methylacidiphilum fumarolicum]|uniref:Transglutaminase-like enzyme, cysteine protease n=2 Tax=Candidatus Methylacidiphilum fumarolicum TaxID=591154 RepID=A0ABN8XDQ5_9BACT|nr:transglutaminase family protein [Candidatus Methylacidiphilum fumarolicum]MBW6415765.1 transglutaminase family protein [Candidatus Methylacidiphilum fumarolicum]TFE66842.1 transglutaminase [Candidatus Methylacidiphilum fumarolicum]TFE72261.1 transglutaminase family protein [Candidatus Methylacidiphilum fumarolicum]TFE72500.1 transglutaminase family protein [Candidatus Methylacidiphilum fumarolicum]TFE77671.1 transglutaminase [Candidatus Methylacidiphilum fumarolicum]